VITRRYPQNRKYITYRNAARGGPSRDHKNAQKCDGVWPCVVRADRQTDRQTDILVTISCTPPEGEVIKRWAHQVRYQHIFLCLFVLEILLLAVVVGHGDDGKDEIDEVERTHEDDDDEEQHMQRPVGAYHLRTET